MKGRVAIVINTSWNIYNFRLGLIESILKEGYELIAIAPEDNYSSKLKEIGCIFYPVEMDNKGSNPLKDIKLIWSLYRIYKKEKPDVVLHYTVKPNLYGTLAAKFLSIPAINNVSGLGTVFLRKSISSSIAKLLYGVVFRFPAHIFFQNHDDKELFVERGLLRVGVSYSVLPGSGVNMQKFKKQSFTKNTPMVFLMIGRLLYDKGIIEYVNAAKKVLNEEKKCIFRILGAVEPRAGLGVEMKEVKQWQSEGWIEYCGFTDNVQSYIHGADCIVLPSYREGTPKTLLEAAACGKPLITTNVPGCKDVVDHGINGFLCEARSSDSLAEAIKKILSCTEAELKLMGESSRIKVEKEFDEQTVINEYMLKIKSFLTIR